MDNALGFSVMSTLPAGSWTVSTEMWLDVLAPLDSAGTRHHVEGRTLARGSYASGQVTVVFTATTRRSGRRFWVTDVEGFSGTRRAFQRE